MSERFYPLANPLPGDCQTALEAIQAAPLELPETILNHLQKCPACAETRVQWLAQEDFPAVLTSAGYFDRLPERILRKLPTRRSSRVSHHPLLWLAAGILAAAVGVGGYMMGRINRAPLVEAALPKLPAEIQEIVPESPFHETDDAVSQLSDLKPEDADEVLNRLNAPQPSKP